MSFREKLTLLPHPACAPLAIKSVSVRLHMQESHIWLGYEVEHDKSLVLPDHGLPPVRRDELWRSTCFELFARSPGSRSYVEYNFAPVAAWAAYSFEDYRASMRAAEVSDPHLVDGRSEDRASEIDQFFEYCVVVPREGVLAVANLSLGLSAVIEEIDGTKSYWALRHPSGDKPDFHHPDCFALELPSASEA